MPSCPIPGGGHSAYSTSILPDPFDQSLEVGVPQEFPCEALLRELHEHDLLPASSGAFHHRQAIGIASDQDDPVDSPVGSVGSNVEAEPHIDTLLLKTWLEVLVRQRS